MTSIYEMAKPLWHSIAGSTTMPRPAAVERASWCGWDRLTNPGYVGREYAGIVFLALNPGNGDDRGPSLLEEELFSRMARLGSDSQEFDGYNEAYFRGLCKWKVARYICEMRVPLETIAFLNLVPWRTAVRPNAPKASDWRCLMSLSDPILRSQLELLEPRMIVVLGKKTHKLACHASSELRSRIAECPVIPRTNGDTYTRTDAQQLIAELRRALRR